MTDRPSVPGSTATWDPIGMATAGLSAAVVYGSSMCREVYWGDSAELSTRALSLDFSPVARGYPLHRALSWLATRIVGDAGLATNLVSVIFGVVSAALLFEGGKRLGGSRWAGAASAGVGTLAHTAWSFAGIAEVHSLHAAILVGLLLLALSAVDGSQATRRLLGLVGGLSLLHHRMIGFAAPGVVALVVLGLLRRPAGDRAARLRDIAAGFGVGMIPFVLLCALVSRSPPDGIPGGAAWWIRDVFMGGETNVQSVLGAGQRPLAVNAAYVGKWIVFCVPGPGLVLAGFGLARLLRVRREAFFLFALLIPAHMVFPLRYDWTGDQFAFLSPLYPILALLAAPGVAEIADRLGPSASRWFAGSAIAAPVVLYTALGWTPLGALLLPGRTDAARLRVVVPWHVDERPASKRCRGLLERVPIGTVLHCDWGDGQVFRYLQRAESRRLDVTVRIWYRTVQPVPDDVAQWVSVMPGLAVLPDALRSVAPRLDPAGDGLFVLRAR